MLVAHCLVSMLRGIISRCPRITDKSMSYQLLECLVRTLIDRYQLKTGQTIKFYNEIKHTELTLQSTLEQNIWNDFLKVEPSCLADESSIYSFSLSVFKNFFTIVSEKVSEYDRTMTYDLVYKYVALVPILLDSVPHEDEAYLDFLKLLMLALIVSFRDAVASQSMLLGNLIQSLRTKLMP